jgi:hypothetical protein
MDTSNAPHEQSDEHTLSIAHEINLFFSSFPILISDNRILGHKYPYMLIPISISISTKANQALPKPDPIIRVSDSLPLSTAQLGEYQEARAET